jgi:uncharacterized protein (TIRG00374 family)
MTPSPEPAPVADAPSSSNQLASGLGRKVLLAMILAALVYAGLALHGDLQKLRGAASTFAPAAFALGLALAAGNYGLRIVRWQYYLKHIGVEVPLGESSVVFLSGFAMSVTPGKVGEVFKSLLLYESRRTAIARTAPIVVAERLTDLIALVLLISIGSMAFDGGVVVAASSALLVAGLIGVCAYRPLGRWLLSWTDRLPLIGRISHKLHEAYDSLLEMTRPKPLLVGSLIALLAWGLECCSLFVIVHGFPGVALSWDAAVFAYAASTMAGALAMMPGGLGVTEVGMAALLEALGHSTIRPAVATATTILVRIATLWFAVVIGFAALGVHRAMQRGRVRPSPTA